MTTRFSSFPAIAFALLLVLCTAQGTLAQETAQDPSVEPPVAQPAYLGVEMGKSPGWGVLVKRVIAKSSAANAGLQDGDLLLGLGGKVTESITDIRTLLSAYSAGGHTQLVFRRGSELHVVDCHFLARSDNREPAHKKSLRLEDTLKFLQIQPGQHVADIGFGNGWLTHGLAQATGLKGHVYAVEVAEHLVVQMKRREIPNVTAVHSKNDDVLLEENSLDIAVLFDVSSHVMESSRPKFYKSLARGLRPDGHMAVFSPHSFGKRRLAELARFGFHPTQPEQVQGKTDEAIDERFRLGMRFVYREAPPEDRRR